MLCIFYHNRKAKLLKKKRESVHQGTHWQPGLRKDPEPPTGLSVASSLLCSSSSGPWHSTHALVSSGDRQFHTEWPRVRPRCTLLGNLDLIMTSGHKSRLMNVTTATREATHHWGMQKKTLWVDITGMKVLEAPQ